MVGGCGSPAPPMPPTNSQYFHQLGFRRSQKALHSVVGGSVRATSIPDYTHSSRGLHARQASNIKHQARASCTPFILPWSEGSLCNRSPNRYSGSNWLVCESRSGNSSEDSHLSSWQIPSPTVTYCPCAPSTSSTVVHNHEGHNSDHRSRFKWLWEACCLEE